MKKIFLTTITALICIGMDAQWYLFPTAAKDSLERDDLIVADSTVVRPDSVSINLFLPIGSLNDNPSQAFSDFYCGALTAVRNLVNDSLAVRLRVIDILSEPAKLNAEVLGSADLNIGPVSFGDIENAVSICPEDKYIISPLEKRAASLVKGHRLIQAPSGKKEQLTELSGWLKEDLDTADRVFVLYDNIQNAETIQLLSELESKGISYDTLSVISFESIPGRTPAKVICAVEKDEVTGNAINEIARMNRFGADISFYGTSGVRTLSAVTVSCLQQANAHICSSYDIEYGDEATREFVLQFREMFHCEPSQFAFSGYDTILYFGKAFAEYGGQWAKKLPEFPRKGIQTDFRFDVSGDTGNQNIAVKRLLFKVTDRSVFIEENPGIGDGLL